MISFVNTKTKTVAIPQEADVWHRNRVHKAMKSIFGEYNMERLNEQNGHTSDIALMDLGPLKGGLIAIEVSAKPQGWAWKQFFDIVKVSSLIPLSPGHINAVKFIET